MSLLLIPEIILYLSGFYFLTFTKTLSFEDLTALSFSILLRIVIMTRLHQTKYIYNSLVSGGTLLATVIAFIFFNFGIPFALTLSPILFAIFLFLQFQKDFNICNYIIKGLLFSFFCLALLCLLTKSGNPFKALTPFMIFINTNFYHPVFLIIIITMFFIIVSNLSPRSILVFHFFADAALLLITGIIVVDTAVSIHNRHSIILQIRIILITTILTVYALSFSQLGIIIPLAVSYLFFIYSMNTGGTIYNENRISLL
ncbi:MAG TPA: hypothetical protein P5123_07840 [Spirochaetota bacterium]|nr:hypothetical protein [Spirochaetota bacterium]